MIAVLLLVRRGTAGVVAVRAVDTEGGMRVIGCLNERVEQAAGTLQCVLRRCGAVRGLAFVE
jgi:hypothetical protein